MAVIMWLASIAVGLVVLFYLRRRNRFSLFKELGIPGPEPSLLSGNLPELTRNGSLASFAEWTKKYGDIVGYYNGSIPYVIVKDPKLLRQIQIKDFGAFQSRGVTSTFSVYHWSAKNSVFNTPAERWKEMRSLLTPTFTSGKMRQMCDLLSACTDEFLAVLEGKVGGAFNIDNDFQRLTMDVIVRAAFGMSMGFQKGIEGSPQENLLETAKEAVKPSIIPGIRLFMNCFSEFGLLWRPFLLLFGWAFKQPVEFLTDDLDSIIEFRRANPTNVSGRREDLLQLMLDASVDHDAAIELDQLAASEGESESAAAGEAEARTQSSGSKKCYMSKLEIRANAATFLLAGFETTSTALVFTTYLLAKFQDVQDKLRNEVLQTLEEHGAFNYDVIFGMKYLEKVFCESLRYYPPVVGFTTRTAGGDYQYGKLRIPSGVAVVVPTYQLHHDPELWAEPEKFDPERFSPENRAKMDPMAFQPFGSGPRNCVGMRFAQLEAKLTLAKMVAKYKLHLDDRHKEPLTVASTTILAYPKGGVWIRLEKLSQRREPGPEKNKSVNRPREEDGI